MRQKKRKTTEQETRHRRHHDSLHCSRVKCNFDRKTLVKPNKLQTGLFHPSKVSLNFSVLKLLNMKLELSKERLKSNQFLLCLFRLPRTITSDIVVRYSCRILCTSSTGYVIKQLVHAFSCALSSYGALGKFGEHSRR